MQHILTPKAKNLPPFCWWQGCFNGEELDYLQNIAKNAFEQAEVGGVHFVNERVRRSSVNWVEKNQENYCVFEKLSEVVSNINRDYYGFDLLGFSEKLQLTNYSSQNQGTYTWHQDFNADCSRKLSLVLQLSEPSDYEGGNLQILTNSNARNVERERGLIALFPSWTLHQVTPVIKGSRQTLVTWICGAPFK